VKTNINYAEIFQYDPEQHEFEVPEEQSWALALNFVKEMFWGGYFDGDAIHIHKFLREDLSINLEQLEVAVIAAVGYLEGVVPFDDPITLYIDNLKLYFSLRNILDKPKNMKEEYYVIRGIVEAVANQESIKPIKVQYVSDPTELIAQGQ
jgi:hypothetical protein